MARTVAQSFNHVALWVSDIRKSADWYIEILGMAEVTATEDHIFLKLANGQILALFKVSCSKEKGADLHHVAMDLPKGQVEAAHETLRRRNIPLKQRGPNLSFQDPDGNWIHFV